MSERESSLKPAPPGNDLRYRFVQCREAFRLRLHEDVFASKCTLSYAFTLPVYTKNGEKRKPETHRFENVFKSGYPG